MRTINTIKKINNQSPNPNNQTNSNIQIPIPKHNRFGKLVIGHWLLFGVWLLVIGVLPGCAQKSDLKQAQEAVIQSEAYYQKAIARYKNLIAQGIDLEKIYFELGRVYYDHGDFLNAIEAFKNSKEKNTIKFLAISYYYAGDFTQGLEIFNKNQIDDDEYLYYHSLTCEKLNLFDQALENYKKITSGLFIKKARLRIDAIEKQASSALIKEIDPKVYNILFSSPGIEEYPEAGGLMLDCTEHIEVNADGTQVSYLHYLIKILNERGKEEFSEAHIDYDSTYERVELEFARTIKPDGSVLEVGARHIRDVSRYLNFPLYSNARVYIISFPEITEGAVIEYKLKIYRNQLINKEDFVIAYPIQSGEPIIAAKFSVSLPKELKAQIKIINDRYNDFGAKLNPDIEEKENSLIYSWQFKAIPQIIPEPDMPPLVQINPTLLISTFNSWQEIYNWWWELASDKINSDTAIKAKVKELIKGKTTQEEMGRAIYNFCAKEIRYVAVEYGQAGYEPHYASDIFKNKYGDCKDQVILLVTMLKEAGISSSPVLIATKEYYNLNEDFPSALFNHCIAAIDLKGELIFLDPTAETCSFGDLPGDDQGRKVLIFKEDNYQIQVTPKYPPEHNLLKQQLKLKINSDESILAQKSIFSFGLYDQAQRYWLLYTQPELIQETLKVKIQETSIGAKLNKYKIDNVKDLNLPVVLSYDFWGPEYFTAAGPLRIMPQLAGLDSSLVAKDKRKFPIDFNILDTKETIAEIEIPKNFIPKFIPENVSEDNPWLNFVVEYNYNKNTLYFRQKTTLKKDTVSEDQYLEFKKLFEGVAKRIKQRIVLEKVK